VLTTGQKLTLLAITFLAVGMIPLQLASPVAPFMDVLAIPAAAQRIVTFHRYMPLDNNPYGLWSPWANAAGLELFLAMLACGAGLHGPGAGVLAQSQAMFPITALMVAGTWKLGKVLYGDLAGGIAALLLWWTCLIRRSQGVRGSTAVFGLIALGLAFWLEHRLWLGGLLLVTAVAVYSMMGAMAVGLAMCSWVARGWLVGQARGWVIVALALTPWLLIDRIDAIAHLPRFYPHTLLWDVAPHLVQYWLPFWLVFPAGAVIATIWRFEWSVR
jgi:hypothetical protein